MARTKSRIKVNDSEPRWKITSEDSQISEMLNWYNYNKSADDAKKYFIEFLKDTGETTDTILKISQCSNLPLSNSVGFLCRIKTINGDVVPKKFDKHIDDAKSKALQAISITKATDTKVQEDDKRPSVQEHLENQLREYLGFLASTVDEFLASKCKLKFDAYEWLKTNAIKHQQAKNIADYYQKTILPELQEALADTCEQLTEGYSFLKKNDLKKYVEFVETLIADTKRWCDVAKQISLNNRAPRAKKPKSPLKQTAKLKYLREHENLKSIPVTEIVGATQLWVYNVKYRTLGVYVCNNAHGFSVKGSTILNYDANESIAKKLRKPEEIIPKVLESGKVALRKILPAIRAKDKKLTGRINRDTILLKAL